MTATEVLSKLLLPRSSDWSIGSVDIDEQNEEVRIELVYNNEMVIIDDVSYPIYDYRSVREWRHLDLWQYKSYLVARIPRYIVGDKAISLGVPWSAPLERMTTLLEKKR